MIDTPVLKMSSTFPEAQHQTGIFSKALPQCTVLGEPNIQQFWAKRPKTKPFPSSFSRSDQIVVQSQTRRPPLLCLLLSPPPPLRCTAPTRWPPRSGGASLPSAARSSRRRRCGWSPRRPPTPWSRSNRGRSGWSPASPRSTSAVR